MLPEEIIELGTIITFKGHWARCMDRKDLEGNVSVTGKCDSVGLTTSLAWKVGPIGLCVLYSSMTPIEQFANVPICITNNFIN